MGIHGLLPPTVFAQEEQAERIMECVDHWGDDLDTYIYLTSLQDRNEKLFFKILADNIEKLAPIVYTPTVGRACENFGFIFRKPRQAFCFVFQGSNALACFSPSILSRTMKLTNDRNHVSFRAHFQRVVHHHQ